MFLFGDIHNGVVRIIFSRCDPRMHGFNGVVMDHVTLDYKPQDIVWPYNPLTCVGRSPEDPKKFKIFRTDEDRQLAGFDLIGKGVPVVVESWSEFISLRDQGKRLENQTRLDS